MHATSTCSALLPSLYSLPSVRVQSTMINFVQNLLWDGRWSLSLARYEVVICPNA